MKTNAHVFNTRVHVICGDANIALDLMECSRGRGRLFVRSFVAFESMSGSELRYTDDRSLALCRHFAHQVLFD